MKDLTDIDYKDLFRDAVNMMAHIARAAGFDPNDPTVEPPAIVARVENLRAEVERLTAERAAVRAALVDSGTEPVTEDMGKLAALVAAQLADEVATIARLDQEIGRLQSALGSEITARQASEAEVERLTAELEEARLTLAAEQGRAEGAPSEGWVFEDGWRRIDAVADRYVCLIDDSDPMSRWCATVITGPEDAAIERETWAPNARAAMLAADTAHPATPETDRPSTPPASPE